MEEFDIKVKERNGAVLVVLDLEPELIIERSWKYRKGIIGIKEVIKAYLYF